MTKSDFILIFFLSKTSFLLYIMPYSIAMKDLLFIDPDDNKPMVEVCKFYKNDVNFVYQADTYICRQY